MATIAGTYKTYNQVGKREDIEDIIYDVSPIMTPFTSAVAARLTFSRGRQCRSRRSGCWSF